MHLCIPYAANFRETLWIAFQIVTHTGHTEAVVHRTCGVNFAFGIMVNGNSDGSATTNDGDVDRVDCIVRILT